MSSKHQHFLQSHCRACGKGFGKAYKFNCLKHKELLGYFGVDPVIDNSLVCPESFCNSCYLTAKKTRASGNKESSRKAMDWFCTQCRGHMLCVWCAVQRRWGKTKSFHWPANTSSAAFKVGTFQDPPLQSFTGCGGEAQGQCKMWSVQPCLADITRNIMTSSH